MLPPPRSKPWPGCGQTRTASPRLGVIVCLQSGCVQYSCRFFDEALKDPATASPLLFPETVFAAPASHVAALLEKRSLAYTLVGDPACLPARRVPRRPMAGGESRGRLPGHRGRRNQLDSRRRALAPGTPGRNQPAAPGRCACAAIRRCPSGVELAAITDAHTYSARNSRACKPPGRCATNWATEFSGELLCDGIGDSPRADAPELAAWRDWTGPRVSPKRILGEGLMAAAAWQCVAACDAVAGGRFAAANVSLVGCNQQAIGARFVRAADSQWHFSICSARRGSSGSIAAMSFAGYSDHRRQRRFGPGHRARLPAESPRQPRLAGRPFAARTRRRAGAGESRPLLHASRWM